MVYSLQGEAWESPDIAVIAIAHRCDTLSLQWRNAIGTSPMTDQAYKGYGVRRECIYLLCDSRWMEMKAGNAKHHDGDTNCYRKLFSNQAH